MAKTFKAKGVAFDMDGTIIDSTMAVEQHWHRIAEELGISPQTVLATSHGRRTIDILQEIDPPNANWDYVREVEAKIPLHYSDSAVEISGARDLLKHLTLSQAPCSIVTSGSTPLVDGWLRVLAIPRPSVLVAAEDVNHGKPDPEGYLKAKKDMGLAPDDAMIVFEDAPAGVRAAKASGSFVVGLSTTHSAANVHAAGADVVVPDLSAVSLLSFEDCTVTIQVRGGAA